MSKFTSGKLCGGIVAPAFLFGLAAAGSVAFATPAAYFVGSEGSAASSTGAAPVSYTRTTTNPDGPFDNGISFAAGSGGYQTGFGTSGFGGKSINIPLALGTDSLQYVIHSNGSYTGTFELTMFFSASSGAYDPSATNTPANPNLAVYTVPGSATFSVPSNGTKVRDYNDNGDGGEALVAYSGATAFTVGSYDVTVTGFTFKTGLTTFNSGYTDGGLLTLNVSSAPTPEPAALGLFGVGAIGLSLLSRRRRAS